MSLRAASHEQRAIIEAVATGHNVIVDAVAGSGKTTVVLHIAQQLRCPITLITYNKMLAEETKVRAKEFRLHNLRVFTFHALAGNIYGRVVKNDEEMVAAMNSGAPTLSTFIGKLLVVDEMQDMCDLYARLINVVRTNYKPLKTQHYPLEPAKSMLQMLCMGDWQQAVYEYKRACDCRYLTHADEVFGLTNVVRLPLHTSYRMTHAMSAFLNQCTATGRPEILTAKNGPPVVIVSGTPELTAKSVTTILRTLKQSRILTDSDIMICSRSTKARQYTKLDFLQRQFQYYGFIVYVCSDDYDVRSTEALAHKVHFSTICRAKGRERRVVVVYDFDDYHGRKTKPTLTKQDYVSLTRATDLLIIVKCGPYVPSVRTGVIKAHAVELNADLAADYLCQTLRTKRTSSTGVNAANDHPSIITITHPQKEPATNRLREFQASDMGLHLDTHIEAKLSECMACEIPNVRRRIYDRNFNLPSESKFFYRGCDIIEEHQNINALVITIALEMRALGVGLAKTSIGAVCRAHESWPTTLATQYGQSLGPQITIAQLRLFIQVAVLFEAISMDYTHRLAQINKYDFLDEYLAEINEVVEIYTGILPQGLEFEKPIVHRVTIACGPELTNRAIKISGRMDATCKLGTEQVREDTVHNIVQDYSCGTHIFEFKFSTELSLVHRLQTINYGVMCGQINAMSAIIYCHLINLRTGHWETYYLPSSKATEVFNEQLLYKCRDEPEKPTDDEFLNTWHEYCTQSVIPDIRNPLNADAQNPENPSNIDAQDIAAADELAMFCGQIYVKRSKPRAVRPDLNAQIDFADYILVENEEPKSKICVVQ